MCHFILPHAASNDKQMNNISIPPFTVDQIMFFLVYLGIVS